MIPRYYDGAEGLVAPVSDYIAAKNPVTNDIVCHRRPYTPKMMMKLRVPDTPFFCFSDAITSSPPQVHAGGEQGAHDAGVPGADDGVPAAALERVPARHARAPVLAAGGGGALLRARTGRRHARADGQRMGCEGERSSFHLGSDKDGAGPS